MLGAMLDIALVLALIGAAANGLRRGIVLGGLPLVGWLVGAVAGLRYLPGLISGTGWVPRDPWVLLLVNIAAVAAAAGVGAALGSLLARAIAEVTDRTPLRLVDAAAGAVAGVLVAATLMWAILPASRPALPQQWSRAVGESRVLGTIDNVMPGTARRLVAEFRSAVNPARFPQVFGELVPEPITEAAPPNDSLTNSAAIGAARTSIVKVRSQSSTCGGTAQGSGWTVARQRIVTNAHVVAGAERVTVQVAGTGPALEATVVSFDPRTDLAILDVPSLTARSLPRVAQISAGDDVVVAGFPQDGRYTLTAARVRSELDAHGRDIYSESPAAREVYAIRGTVLPGNSGGPLLTTDGAVAGTVFARSIDTRDTGYVLTDEGTDATLDAAAGLGQPVSTGACLVR